MMISELLKKNFKEGKFTEGLSEGILLAGKQLKTHFPHKKDDVNELPDEISFDKIKREIMIMIKKSLYLLILSVLFFTVSIDRVFSQNIPERPVPPRLVNDFAGIA